MRVKRENKIKRVGKKIAFMQKNSDVNAVFSTRQSIIVLLYKEVHFSIDKLDPSLPSIVQSLLQDYEDVFPNDIPNGLPPLRGIEH